MKPYISIGIVIVGLIVSGIWKFNSSNLRTVTSVINNTTTSPTVTITPLQQEVAISTTTETFSPISGVSKVNPGTNVKTNTSGRALIEGSANHTTLLDYNTQITITEDSKTENKTKIALLSGAIWARLEKVFDKGEYYEIKTSNIVASVRGTSFRV